MADQHGRTQGPPVVFSTLSPTHGQPIAHPVGIQHGMPYYVAPPQQHNQEPPWVSKLVTHINQNKAEIMDKIGEVSYKVSQLENDMKAVHELSAKVHGMEDTIRTMWDQMRELREECIYEKGRSMRDNLLFHGIREQPGENTEEVVYKLINDTLRMDCSRLEIMRCHRMGARRQNKIRPIVAKFLRYTDKEKLKRTGFDVLRNTSHGVSDQYPPEINERRRLLVPILRQEKQRRGPSARTNLVVDKLYTEDCTYSVVDGRVKQSDPQPRTRKYRRQDQAPRYQHHRSDYLQQQQRQIAQNAELVQQQQQLHLNMQDAPLPPQPQQHQQPQSMVVTATKPADTQVPVSLANEQSVVSHHDTHVNNSVTASLNDVTAGSNQPLPRITTQPSTPPPRQIGLTPAIGSQADIPWPDLFTPPTTRSRPANDPVSSANTSVATNMTQL